MQSTNNPLKPMETPLSDLPSSLVRPTAYLLNIYGVLILALCGLNLYAFILIIQAYLQVYLFAQMHLLFSLPLQIYATIGFLIFGAYMLLKAGYMLLKMNFVGVRAGIIAVLWMSIPDLFLVFYRYYYYRYYSIPSVYEGFLFEALVIFPFNITLIILLTTLAKKLRQEK